jgi:NADPH:quinone reductase-like Zn-dependent oxidoreductase
MKALCVNPDRTLELRDIPEPAEAPAGHLLVELDSAAINPGDKTFLARPDLMSMPARRYDVWGASGSGRVISLGEGAPARYLGRHVALYRSLNRSPETLGLWSQKAIVAPSACLLLPDTVRARDYCGSLVNVFTAYAFLEEARAQGHAGVVATAGNSATGRALLALARARGITALLLARTPQARDDLLRNGAEHALTTSEADFDRAFAELSACLRTTAIFEGVGGDLVGRLAPLAPFGSTFFFYGFLAGPKPVSLPSAVFMAKDLTMKRFSNFESATAKDPERLAAALGDLESLIEDPLFRTQIGREFRFEQFEEAMAYQQAGGAKAVLVA